MSAPDAKTTDEPLAGCLMLVIGFPLLLAVGTLVWWTGWRWFVVPTLGAPPLQYFEVMGLRALYASFRGIPDPKKDSRSSSEILAVSVFGDLLFLLVMVIAHQQVAG